MEKPEEKPGVPPPPRKYLCLLCSNPMRFIKKYQHWYCERCKKYDSDMPVYPCTRCGKPLRFTPQYQRWYCDTCGTYPCRKEVAALEKVEEKAAPSKEKPVVEEDVEKPEEKPGIPQPLPPPAYAPPAREIARKKEGPYGLIGGIFMILGAIALIIGGGYLTMTIISRAGAFELELKPMMPLLVLDFGYPLIIGITELIGGAFAIQRTHRGFALMAAILGGISAIFLYTPLTAPFSALTDTILGLSMLGILFVAVGKKEFVS